MCIFFLGMFVLIELNGKRKWNELNTVAHQ